MGNPVLGRELLSLFRSRRMALIQVLIPALLGLLVLLRWPTEDSLSGNRPREVFRLFGMGLLSAMLLLMPVFPATSIVKEKLQGTLALLLNTPLGAFKIYSGKLLAIMSLAVLVLLLSLPAACACYALGGIALDRDLLRLYLLLALVALQCTALGLLVSTYAGSIDGAIRATYGIMLGLSVLSMGPNYFFSGDDSSFAVAGDWIRCCSPFSALMSVLGAADMGSQGIASKTDVPRLFMIFSLVMAAVCGAWTIARLRGKTAVWFIYGVTISVVVFVMLLFQMGMLGNIIVALIAIVIGMAGSGLNHSMFDFSHSAGIVSDDQALGVRLFRRLLFVVDPNRRSPGIPPLVNPVMVKEFRCRKFGRLHWLLRLVAVMSILSLGLAFAATVGAQDWDVYRIGAIIVILQVALFVLITPSVAAALISSERESGGWLLLQSTPLSPWRIVWGKLLSVILTVALVFCATLPGYVVIVWIEPGIRSGVERAILCLAFTAVFTMMASAGIGSLFKRTTASTTVSYVVLLLITVVPLLIWLGRDAPFGQATVQRALLINPAAAALSALRVEGFTDYNLIPGNWWFLGGASVVSLVTLLVQTWRISRPQ
ncbi:MAG: ABC transporter permease [Planctomycetota bacterium]|nr:ABC transporter permease [Planctomycetota bacterium]